jgi:CheY-like chemotaxis protein
MNGVKHILLADDQVSDVELTLAALEECKLDAVVSVARDGVEALDYLYCRGKFEGRKGGNPAAVWLDIKMPRMDGLEVLQRIKADPKLKLIQVVMLTSSREEPDLTMSYELGIAAYVVKPLDFEQFADAVKHLGIVWAVLNELPAPETTNP